MGIAASLDGIKKAKRALIRKGLTQLLLAEDIGIARSTCSNFFNGRPVNHNNFQEICFRLDLDWKEIFEPEPEPEPETEDEVNPNIPPSLPYVERPPIESECYKTIDQPGALIRIKSPQMMGKRLLIKQILTYAKTQKHYQTSYFDLSEPQEETIADLDQLLQYLCRTVSADLDLEDEVEQYWKENRAITLNCKTQILHQEKLI